MLSFITLIHIAAITLPLEPCLALEPSVSELVGVVEERTFAGPPNHGGSPIDSRETQLILVLVIPTCVKPSEPDKSWGPFTEITLVPTQTSSQSIPRNKRIKVVGILFEAHTTHHHTPLLMSVQSVAEVV